MNDEIDDDVNASKAAQSESGMGWGPKLFLATLAALLVFFWWLLIYSGGVSGHH